MDFARDKNPSQSKFSARSLPESEFSARTEAQMSAGEGFAKREERKLVKLFFIVLRLEENRERTSG